MPLIGNPATNRALQQWMGGPTLPMPGQNPPWWEEMMKRQKLFPDMPGWQFMHHFFKNRPQYGITPPSNKSPLLQLLSR